MSASDNKRARSDGFVAASLADVPFPAMVKVRQQFDETAVKDPSSTLIKELGKAGIMCRVRPGMRIAITGGSRGIAKYEEMIRMLAAKVTEAGAYPVIVPAMGSHGGATAEGQLRVLATLGITEKQIGCPVRSTMETVHISDTPDGLPVYMDRLAWESDGIILLNRVKYHTGFSGNYESGLVKMIVIGLGKQQGAEICHSLGLGRMAGNIEAIAGKVLESGKILFGVATIENAYDRIAHLEAIPAEAILSREPELLRMAKEKKPSLPVSETDVLIVDEIGKNISGGGMDPHIVGRFVVPEMEGGIHSQNLVVLDITPESEGSGIGLGRAELTTQRVFDLFDFEQTYPNALTSKVLHPSRIPIVLANDRLAVAAAVKTCTGIEGDSIRIVRIKNSLEITELFMTENLVLQAQETGRITSVSKPQELRFDDSGRIAPFNE
jgi:Lactate racemase N-terminal domain